MGGGLYVIGMEGLHTMECCGRVDEERRGRSSGHQDEEDELSNIHGISVQIGRVRNFIS